MALINRGLILHTIEKSDRIHGICNAQNCRNEYTSPFLNVNTVLA